MVRAITAPGARPKARTAANEIAKNLFILHLPYLFGIAIAVILAKQKGHPTLSPDSISDPLHPRYLLELSLCCSMLISHIGISLKSFCATLSIILK